VRFRFNVDELKNPVQSYFSAQREVRLQEVDAAGIVFFPRILEYVSDAFVTLCSDQGMDLARVLRERQWSAPVRYVEAEYYRPLRFGDRVEVALVAIQLGESQVDLGYRVLRLSDESVAAVAQAEHVFVDPETFTRSSVPLVVRTAFSAWLK
jgi:1,4-dihydroxy-2-naphthoyl-CoA hydrolase